MYNPLLDTFLAVADCGSFTKAADKLFISPTAVMKKMNASFPNHKLHLVPFEDTTLFHDLSVFNRARKANRRAAEA